MLDPRHPEGSLFSVAESDCRFYPEDCVETWYDILQDEEQPWLLEDLTELHPSSSSGGEQPSPSPAEGEEPSPSPAEGEEPKEGQIKRRKYLGWSAAQRIAKKATEVEISPELREMVQICNRAPVAHWTA